MEDELIIRAAGVLRQARATRVDLLFTQLRSATVQRRSRRVRSDAMEVVARARNERTTSKR